VQAVLCVPLFGLAWLKALVTLLGHINGFDGCSRATWLVAQFGRPKRFFFFWGVLTVVPGVQTRVTCLAGLELLGKIQYKFL
jgi:hypothetical protein